MGRTSSFSKSSPFQAEGPLKHPEWAGHHRSQSPPPPGGGAGKAGGGGPYHTSPPQSPHRKEQHSGADTHHRVPFASAASKERDQRDLPSSRLGDLPATPPDSHVASRFDPFSSLSLNSAAHPARRVGRGGPGGDAHERSDVVPARPREPERAERLSDTGGCRGACPPAEEAAGPFESGDRCGPSPAGCADKSP